MKDQIYNDEDVHSFLEGERQPDDSHIPSNAYFEKGTIRERYESERFRDGMELLSFDE